MIELTCCNFFAPLVPRHVYSVRLNKLNYRFNSIKCTKTIHNIPMCKSCKQFTSITTHCIQAKIRV